MTRIFLLFYLLFSLMLSASMGGGSFRRYSKTSGNIQRTYSPLGDRLSAKYSAGSTAVEEKYSYFGDNLFEIRKGTDLQKVICEPGIDEIYGITASSGDRFFSVFSSSFYCHLRKILCISTSPEVNLGSA